MAIPANLIRRTTWSALLAAFLVVLLVLWPSIRRGYDVVLLLGDLLGHPVPAAFDYRPDVQRRAIAFDGPATSYRGDLYRPEGPVRAAIVLVPGAAEQGKDDPRVVHFATALAGASFAVLVPDVVALRELRLLPESARDVAAALSWMQAQPGLAPAGRLGLVTTSVAIGPALLALLNQPQPPPVRFVVTIGGYHDLPRTLTYLTTGVYEAHGVSLRGQPSVYGKWIYALSTAARFEDADERRAFEALARRKLADPEADVTAELAESGQAGRAVYEFIVNEDPARSGALLEDLSARLRADVRALNLAAHDLSGIAARFLVVHGQDDDMIPYGESISLAQALPGARARLFLLRGFGHVEAASLFETAARAWVAIDALLKERAV